MKKLTFSGHETFHCRHLWLKKGYDFINSQNKFSEPDSVVQLGVGKNMVVSIQYWMHAFGLLDEKNQLTLIANFLFGKGGKDPFLEDYGTLWLLHYFLVKTGKASIYSLVFNEFRKERTEFTKKHLESFIVRKCNELNLTVSPNSIKRDIGVFLKNYISPMNSTTNIEDDFSAILINLDLVKEMNVSESGGYLWYTIETLERDEIPLEILLFSILDTYRDKKSISFQNLINDENSIGCIFSMNANGVKHNIDEIIKMVDNIVYTDDAGIKELQFKATLNKWDILNKYYAN